MSVKQIKAVSAAVGAAALLSMGALTVAAEQTSAAEPLPLQAPSTTPEITMGETSTDAGAPSSPETSVATPEITTPPSTIGQEPES
ncbi:hypothetical protein [Mycolicibacterium holsaticum]|uniref:hypothetical protein n=1 Tax=Mycolicibacterium holsaticum TaxID=152142 RepID=UPI001C7D61E0|nr:hypothetical protein [Mycolicibacterium holsaticum]MDA4105723.1 hypothetical protein [Mycolicibacterium holsaticum DSM 44478 = JCM 12374]QZA13907.1 hypothetical protein K3U96_07200 [Mycolicibacterium holsaticum DSM 44478 = JCM 12374]UNC08634.1 hypothetical protein H5U41_19630 [Mycolicibacterium holsaticum DSM 44478 = JCM 12374]